VAGAPRGSFRGGVDLLVVSRFFQRALLRDPDKGDTQLQPQPLQPPSQAVQQQQQQQQKQGWAAADLVAPGGVVFWHHFREGVQHHPLGHPSSPDDIVGKGEFSAAFAGWRVLVDDEVGCLPDGRPVATFIAQRPL